MGLLVEATFVNGRVKYPQTNQDQIDQIARLKQFVAANEGQVVFKYFMTSDEIESLSGLPKYYRTIMLGPLLPKISQEYGLKTVSELDALLSVFFLQKQFKKSDGKEYTITLRIEDLPKAEQVQFIAKVAGLAIKHGIKYPNINELK